MINEFFSSLLDEYSVDDSFAKKVRNNYREELETALMKAFDRKPKFRYGGSLSKGTANTNSCDIDLLCYLPSDEQISIENIYEQSKLALRQSGFIFQSKNSAICVYGKSGNQKWEMTVDIVPGKYTSNDSNKDVFLWCNKEKCRLKSNPEIQINKVKESKSKEIIRLIKLYRYFNDFEFKSFFLENFLIDVIEPKFEEGDSTMDKLIKFCSHWSEIGETKICDPANSNNDIMSIHSKFEFFSIREKIHNLYEALMTNDEETIKKCFFNEHYSLDEGYLRDAKNHSQLLNIENHSQLITLNGYIMRGERVSTLLFASYVINKHEQLKFIINIPNSISVKYVRLIVSNGGYDAYKNNCPRGGAEDTIREDNNNCYLFYRTETTEYYGNHVVQAIVGCTTGNTYLSNFLIVKIR